MQVYTLSYALLVLITFVDCSKEIIKRAVNEEDNKTTLEEYEKWLPLLQKSRNCRLVCDGPPPDLPGKNITKYPDGSWSFKLQIKTDQFLHIAFNNSLHFLAVFNPKLNMIWISNGILIGIVNLSKNVLFLIDTTKNLGSIFTNIGQFYIDGQINMMLTFSSLFNFAFSKSINMVSNFAFDMTAFFKALQSHTLESFFHGHLDLLNVFKVNFGIYITGSMQFNSFNALMLPIIGTETIGLEIYSSLTGSIHYGTQFTMESIGFIYIGIGEISFQIQSIIDNSFKSVLNLGDNTWNGLWNTGLSIQKLLTGSFSIGGGGSIRLSLGADIKKGFFLNFGNNTNNYGVEFNATQNMLGILSQNQKLSLIFNGNSGSMLLMNLTTGIGLIVKYSGVAKLITNETVLVFKALDSNLKVDMSARLSFLGEILKKYENFNENDKDVFNFKAYLQAILYKEPDASLFKDNPEIELMINNNFGNMFNLVTNLPESKTIFKQFGISIIFNAVFQGNVIGDNLAQLLNKIYIEKQGKFDANIMNRVHAEFKAKIKSGNTILPKVNIFDGIFKACFGFKGVLGYIGLSKNC